MNKKTRKIIGFSLFAVGIALLIVSMIVAFKVDIGKGNTLLWVSIVINTGALLMMRSGRKGGK